MTTTITLQLPDDIAQQLQTEAQKQNTTVESLATQRLMQTSSTAQATQNLSDETPVQDDSVIEMFSRISEAKKLEADQIQVPATDLTRHVANFLMQHNLIQSVESDASKPYESITLHLVQETPAIPKNRLDDLLNLPTDDPELKQILQKLKDPDPKVCIQGVNALGDLYSEPA